MGQFIGSPLWYFNDQMVTPKDKNLDPLDHLTAAPAEHPPALRGDAEIPNGCGDPQWMRLVREYLHIGSYRII